MCIKTILYTAAAVLSVIPAILINSPVSYLPFAFIAVTALVSACYMLILTRCYEVVMPSKAEKTFPRGTVFHYPIVVRNRSIFVFPQITVVFSIDNSEDLNLGSYTYDFVLAPKEDKSVFIPIDLQHIGRYTISIKELRIFGFLNLFSARIPVRWETGIQITPLRHDVSSYKIRIPRGAVVCDVFSRSKLNTDEYTDVKEYIPGDPIKTIHWKLSAHTSSYMSRIIRTDAVNGISIYLDFHVPASLSIEDAANLYDAVVESGYSIGVHALANTHCVELIYTHENIPQISVASDLETLEGVMRSLPDLSRREGASTPLLVSGHSLRSSSLDNVLIVTGNVTEELAAVLLSCRELGKYPVLFFIKSSCRSYLSRKEKASLSFLKKHGIPYYIIEVAEELAQHLGGTS